MSLTRATEPNSSSEIQFNRGRGQLIVRARIDLLRGLQVQPPQQSEVSADF